MVSNSAMALSGRAADSSCSSSSCSSAEVLAANVRRECGWMIDGSTRGSWRRYIGEIFVRVDIGMNVRIQRPIVRVIMAARMET